jgi:hypothetical protein
MLPFAAAAILLSFSLTNVPCANASDTSSSTAQSDSTPSAPLLKKLEVSQCRSGEMRDHDRITVEGCLATGNEGFYFSNYSGKHYDLIADDSLLGKHSSWTPGINVCVKGTLSSDGAAINVISIRNLPKRVARLSHSIGRPSQWAAHMNQTYGLSFRLPGSFPATKHEGDQFIQPNFAIKKGVITLERFTIGGDVFTTPALPECDKGTNFFDGRLDIFVNPEISNSGSCYQFGQSDREYTGSETFNGKKFSETTEESIGTGRYYHYDYYDTFQNGLCYEFVFSDYSSAINPDDPCGCTRPVVSDYDTLTDEILSQFSFAKPQGESGVSKR